jgi:membrane-associated protease RseP (regulator of RpoE activity)
MEQTALSPKARPGDGPGGDVPDPVPDQVPDHDQAPDEDRPSGPARRPHAAPRRARQRVVTLVFALVTCVVLVLSGLGLGALGLTTTGVGVLEAAGWAPAASSRPDSGGALPTAPVPALAAAPGPGPAPALGGSALDGPAPVRATLGIEAVDATGGTGALVVGVHVPGPGYGAGLVRGDVLLAVGDTRTGSAADLARAIAAARPGTPAKLLVRHANGTRRYLMAVPGVAV